MSLILRRRKPVKPVEAEAQDTAQPTMFHGAMRFCDLEKPWRVTVTPVPFFTNNVVLRKGNTTGVEFLYTTAEDRTRAGTLVWEAELISEENGVNLSFHFVARNDATQGLVMSIAAGIARRMFAGG